MSQDSRKTPDNSIQLPDLAGYDLGEQVLDYVERDVILYALAVGATTQQLDLVYEQDLRALPTYACALGLWAVERAGKLGAYDPKRSLHASQSLVMHRAMPVTGPIVSRGRIVNVWDKGKAALVEIEVSSPVFTALYTIFLPGMGGWGGERGSSAVKSGTPEHTGPDWTSTMVTGRDQATLYRLTGDRHPIHIEEAVAAENGFERPILHGLCTLGIAARELAAAAGAHPAGLRELHASLAAPVLPGDAIDVLASGIDRGQMHFTAKVGETVVLKGGRACFIL
ncbi:MAG: MaoC family dehydratase N-terminal domain-containing protein [Halioglobus sp.]|nr:MaoC family dehydratase N-terminal domain-containing protein [Halioglobus sp.]